MKEMIIFRTVSFGGIEGRTREVRNFETEEIARENAKKDNWNDCFSMYKVTIIFNGIITEKEEYMGEISCGRDAQKIINAEKHIDKMIEEIEKQKNNKRIKESTRIERIKEIEETIEMEKEYIKKIKEKK